MEMENQTKAVTSFVLSGFSFDLSVNMFSFFLFSFMYLLTLLFNTVIIMVTSHLSTPMYFFLTYLAFLDISFSSVTVPKLLLIFWGGKTISFYGCFTQMFFVILTLVTEDYILAAMAYDRYAAICKPLHYVLIMNKVFCRKLVAGSWAVGFLSALIVALPTMNLHYCGSNIIKDYSCEYPSLIALSCTDTLISLVSFFLLSAVVVITTLATIIFSYINIIASILKLNTAEAKRKTFSTCSSHLIIVILYYSTACFRYLRPSSASSFIVDLLFSIQYSIVTPMMNPLIYSLKNKEVKESIKKLMKNKCLVYGSLKNVF